MYSQQEASNCSSYCSGSFNFENFQIKLKSQEQITLKFPEPNQKDIQIAIKYGKKSGFGRNKENVLDESYRMAYQYPRDQVELQNSFLQKINYNVTQQISNAISSDREVRLELIKLNIYPKGGLFKKHVDSPKKNSFGSLVIFLPCYFQGGDLIVEDKNEKAVFSFGEGKEKQYKFNWVAFYNDRVHQIKEVTQGYRMTLSYNLYYLPSKQISFYPQSKLVDELSKLKKNEVYGYYCNYYYNDSLLNEQLQDSLKGSDYAFYQSARAAGVKDITIKSIYRKNLSFGDYFGYQWVAHLSQAQKEQCKSMMFKRLDNDVIEMIGDADCIGEGERNPLTIYGQQYSIKQCVFNHLGIRMWIDFEKIIWLNDRSQSPGYTYAFNAYIGNYYEDTEQYCQLVLLIEP